MSPVGHAGLWPNDLPGFGIDIGERQAAQFPFPDHPLNASWPPARGTDGAIVRP